MHASRSTSRSESPNSFAPSEYRSTVTPSASCVHNAAGSWRARRQPRDQHWHHEPRRDGHNDGTDHHDRKTGDGNFDDNRAECEPDVDDVSTRTGSNHHHDDDDDFYDDFYDHDDDDDSADHDDDHDSHRADDAK